MFGRVKMICRNGISLADPAFGLAPQQQARLAEVFPGIGARVKISFRDSAGREETGPDLAFKIRNLDVHALDDVVGTYLADDELLPAPDTASHLSSEGGRPHEPPPNREIPP